MREYFFDLIDFLCFEFIKYVKMSKVFKIGKMYKKDEICKIWFVILMKIIGVMNV